MFSDHNPDRAQNKSWESLLFPGNAGPFFEDSTPAIDARQQDYSHHQAWTFSELSRLVYRQDPDEKGAPADGPLRSDLLKEAGFRERPLIHSGTTQCILIDGTFDSEPVTVLMFRGTHALQDWMTNLNTPPIANPQGGRIHRGFKQALDDVWPEIIQELSADCGTLFISGHSLGGALAVAAASRSEISPQAVYTFGAPRVGDAEFNTLLESTAVHRVVNASDIVPTLPPWQIGFKHAGTLHYLQRTGEYVENPPWSLVYDNRIEAALDLEDFGRQFTTLAPHQMLYLHAPINYSAALRRLFESSPRSA